MTYESCVIDALGGCTRWSHQHDLEEQVMAGCDAKAYGAFGKCSDDSIEVWHGLAKPAVACGRHVRYNIRDVFAGHRQRIGLRP